MQTFASAFSTGVMGCIGAAMLVMFIVAVSALVHRAAMGGATEYAVFNLGSLVPKKGTWSRRSVFWRLYNPHIYRMCE